MAPLRKQVGNERHGGGLVTEYTRSTTMTRPRLVSTCWTPPINAGIVVIVVVVGGGGGEEEETVLAEPSFALPS